MIYIFSVEQLFLSERRNLENSREKRITYKLHLHLHLRRLTKSLSSHFVILSFGFLKSSEFVLVFERVNCEGRPKGGNGRCYFWSLFFLDSFFCLLFCALVRLVLFVFVILRRLFTFGDGGVEFRVLSFSRCALYFFSAMERGKH